MLKNIAICISGHMRSFQEGYQCIVSSLIKPNDNFKFYFFIDTWDKVDWRTEGKFQSIDIHAERINDLYQPAHMLIEKEMDWDTKRYMKYVSDISCLKKGYGGVRSKGEHIPAMFYKIQSCNTHKSDYEKDNNFKFDLVMRHRTDIKIDGIIDLSYIFSHSQDTIFVPRCDNLPKFPCKRESHTRDMFAISSSENIDYYSQVYSHLDSLCRQVGEFRPEIILHKHLQNNDKIKTIEIEYSWDVM